MRFLSMATAQRPWHWGINTKAPMIMYYIIFTVNILCERSGTMPSMITFLVSDKIVVLRRNRNQLTESQLSNAHWKRQKNMTGYEC